MIGFKVRSRTSTTPNLVLVGIAGASRNSLATIESGEASYGIVAAVTRIEYVTTAYPRERRLLPSIPLLWTYHHDTSHRETYLRY